MLEVTKMEKERDRIRRSSITETRDLIVTQDYNGYISVTEKMTGATIVQMPYLQLLTKEQLDFIASDCQYSYATA
jgi:hypothetical protein